MRTWLRELLGLGLVFTGLFAWLLATERLYDIALIEGALFFFMGLSLFKGGLHLLKVSLAARILLDADAPEKEPPARRAAAAGRKT